MRTTSPFSRLVPLVAVLALLLTALPSTAMAKPGNNDGGPGNSGSARMCKKEGWVTKARGESPSIAFLNQDECVSYGAQGGEIIPLANHVVTLEWSRIPITFVDGPKCWVTVTVIGQEGRYTVSSPDWGEFFITVEGTQGSTPNFATYYGIGSTLSVTVNGVTATSTASC
jgi:hypothetical protein